MWHKDTVEWIDIELTSYCNIECPGCLRQEMSDKVGPLLNKSYITLEDLKKWIPSDYLPNLKNIKSFSVEPSNASFGNSGGIIGVVNKEFPFLIRRGDSGVTSSKALPK